MTSTITFTGLDIINSMRQKLNQTVSQYIIDMSDARDTYNIISGYLAVCASLDIISQREYHEKTKQLHEFLTCVSDEPIDFAPLTDHGMRSIKILEARMLLQITLQESLNLNLKRFRDPLIEYEQYTKTDCVNANKIFIRVASEFGLIDEKQTAMANKIMKEYESNKPQTEKIIFVPEVFYTKKLAGMA